MAYHELKLTIQPSQREILINHLAGKGCLGFIEDDVHLIAYFPDMLDIKNILSEIDAIAPKEKPDTIKYVYSLLPDQDWNESWKKGFKPLNAGNRFTILPPWEKETEGRINLIIDPGMAFGTGHHETTRSCLVLIEKYNGKIAKDSFLDLGTGTGLLAIAASKLGYRKIVAVDTDPLAAEAARMNMKLNKVSNIEVREGSMNAVAEQYDCIAANIISGVLIMLAPEIAEHMNQPGIAILSGILSEQADEVILEMQKQGLTLKESFPDDKWISLVLAK